MSYSYVKTVFPEYKYSNVYNESLYANLNGGGFDVQPIQPIEGVKENIKKPIAQSFENNYASLKSNEFKTHLENFGNQQLNKDNLHFYNSPILNSNIPSYPNVDYQYDNSQNNKISGVEKFESQVTDMSNHEETLKHLTSCTSCKEVVLKHFNIESDRMRNEQIMELISYMLLGLFILLLLESVKK